jgi:hypothetical protein
VQEKVAVGVYCSNVVGGTTSFGGQSKRIAMILVGVVIALLAVAQHFGWIAGPPPLLAPGIQ